MSEEILFGKGEENPFGEFFIGKSYLNILAQAGEVMVQMSLSSRDAEITGIFTMHRKMDAKFYL